MRKSIGVVLGDAGSAYYVLPVLSGLREYYDVHLFVDAEGGAQGILMRSREPYRILSETDNLSRFSLIMCGISGKAPNAWIRASQVARRDGVPLLWFGDFFGSGTEIVARSLSPNLMAAFDRRSASRFRKAHPDLSSAAIAVVGNPSFDRIGSINRYAVRRVNRNRLALTPDNRHVHYSASSIAQFDVTESFLVLEPWVRSRNLSLSIGFHPADDAARTTELRESLASRLGSRLITLGARCAVLDIALASDCFVTDYSTSGVEATVAEVPTAFLMLPSARHYQESRGGEFPFLPLIADTDTVTPALGIFAQEGAMDRLDRLLNPEYRERMKDRLRFDFAELCDWQAGPRFLDFVERAFQ